MNEKAACKLINNRIYMVGENQFIWLMIFNGKGFIDFKIQSNYNR